MNHAARSIEADLPRTRGRLVTLLIDLADLGSIRTAADEFLAREDRLDVLVHNAGVMTPPVGSKSKAVRYSTSTPPCLGIHTAYILNKPAT